MLLKQCQFSTPGTIGSSAERIRESKTRDSFNKVSNNGLGIMA